MHKDIPENLRCISCHHFPLDQGDKILTCPNCQLQYPVLDGVPILMSSASKHNIDDILGTNYGKAMLDEYSHTKTDEGKSTRSLLSYLRPPEIMYYLTEDRFNGPAAEMFSNYGQKKILNVGGGPTREIPTEVTLNIRTFANVDMVADAHDIPFKDNSFDAVYSLAVLEHVTNPYKVVSEMIRVLKPGGTLYSEVPFIFFFHGYPNDFRRFTLEGMKRLFSGLENAEYGMTQGPVSAVLQSGNMVFSMLVPARFKILRKLLNGFYRLVFFPFKYLDLIIKKHPDAHTVAGGFYVIGKKPES